MKLLNSILLFILLVELCSCATTQNLKGVYISKFAGGGFFGTRIRINSDITFDYRFSGDLFYDSSYGQYKVSERYISLNYVYPTRDTTDEFYLLNKNPAEGNRPYKLFIGHNKLFKVDSSGRLQKKELAEVKRIKLIPFRKKLSRLKLGETYSTLRKKKFYYKKIS